METRQLGRRKLGTLEVSALGHGCMSISANYGPPADRNQGINVIRVDIAGTSLRSFRDANDDIGATRMQRATTVTLRRFFMIPP